MEMIFNRRMCPMMDGYGAMWRYYEAWYKLPLSRALSLALWSYFLFLS